MSNDLHLQSSIYSRYLLYLNPFPLECQMNHGTSAFVLKRKALPIGVAMLIDYIDKKNDCKPIHRAHFEGHFISSAHVRIYLHMYAISRCTL